MDTLVCLHWPISDTQHVGSLYKQGSGSACPSVTSHLSSFTDFSYLSHKWKSLSSAECLHSPLASETTLLIGYWLSLAIYCPLREQDPLTHSAASPWFSPRQRDGPVPALHLLAGRVAWASNLVSLNHGLLPKMGRISVTLIEMLSSCEMPSTQ